MRNGCWRSLEKDGERILRQACDVIKARGIRASERDVHRSLFPALYLNARVIDVAGTVYRESVPYALTIRLVMDAATVPNYFPIDSIGYNRDPRLETPTARYGSPMPGYSTSDCRFASSLGPGGLCSSRRKKCHACDLSQRWPL